MLRPSAVLVDRRGGLVKVRDGREWAPVATALATFDTMMTHCADPRHTPEMLVLREQIRGWRFYDHFRTDAASPARLPQIGTHTPVLGHVGRHAPLPAVGGRAADAAPARAAGAERARDQPAPGSAAGARPPRRPAATRSQVIVVSHAAPLIDALQSEPSCQAVTLSKAFGETAIAGSLEVPRWEWPAR